MKQSVFYLKKLTSAEVGTTKAHVGGYIRLPNDFDYELFFQSEGTDNNGVTEIIFNAYNLNKGIVESNLRFAYFGNSNKERRIPNLATLYKDNDVEEGDVVKLESRISDGIAKVYIQFFKNSEVRTSASNIFFVRDESDRDHSTDESGSNAPLQQIFYGAPGTGKSHEINRLTEGKNVVRTTFHPDTDYSTFVGCYKPHMEEVDMTTIIGETLKTVKDERGNPKPEKRIVYKYSCQAFLQAYIDAWQQPEQEHYLVIEEINRGNCAQIFGDIFQLLDRNEEGFSSYPIKTDTDAENELRAVFQEKWTLADDKAQEIDNLYRKHYPNGITKDIKNGSLLLLPSNLYIWATMNTSDQSLFPIDSAFKRRWDWKYIKISEGRDADTKELLNWIVKFKFTDEDKPFTFECSWWDFINAINEKIASATSSDDKKLGYFFCKPKVKGGKEIDSETFVGKVVFYLWNDVFKDEDNPIFKVTEGKANPSFDDFYTENESGKTIADTTALRTFMHNVFGEQSNLYTETEIKAE